MSIHQLFVSYFFFFNDTATTEIYTLSLHDALPISQRSGHPAVDYCRLRRCASGHPGGGGGGLAPGEPGNRPPPPDRKSTRLNSSHLVISYAVFCLKKKKTKKDENTTEKNMYNRSVL